MKIFVCEFVTGGGLYRAALPPSLAREGSMMLQSLLNDLAEIPGVEIVTTHDMRLPPLHANSVAVAPGDDVWASWGDLIAGADALWPIAPESSGILQRLSEMAVRHGKQLLNSTPYALAIAASKLQTSRILQAADIACIPTVAALDWSDDGAGRWVLKPDDGVGCEDSHVLDSAAAVQSCVAQGRQRSHVVQPYMAGEAASLSLLCRESKALLLSCNRQLLEVRDGMFHYRGSRLNDFASCWDACEVVVQQVARALPGLAGYVGVDVLIQEKEIVVVEINPRLTTSYAGLRRAAGCNPAELVMAMFYNANLTWPAITTRNVVDILLDE